MKILYLHAAGPFGGSSRSLYEMLRALDRSSLDLVFLTQKGSSSTYFSELGKVYAVKGVSQFDHGRYSFYRKLRWLILFREFFYIPFTLIGLLRIKFAEGKIDVVHANDFVCIFPLLIAKYLFGAKTVVHVRCLLCNDPMLFRTRWLAHVLRRYVDQVISIDETVRRTLSANVESTVIHNGLHLVGHVPNFQTPSASNSVTPLRIGFMGNLLRQKGVLDLVAAAHLLARRGYRPEFVIYGDVPPQRSRVLKMIVNLMGVQQDVKEEMRQEIDRCGLNAQFDFRGFTNDLATAYCSMDLVCFPSHLNAPGRPVIEAAYFSKAAIVAVDDPTSDTLIPDVTGVAFRSCDVEGLALAMEKFLTNPMLASTMGLAANELSRRYYDQKRNAAQVREIYTELTNHRK